MDDEKRKDKGDKDMQKKFLCALYVIPNPEYILSNLEELSLKRASSFQFNVIAFIGL